MKFWNKLLELFTGSPVVGVSSALTERKLIEFESEVGRELFGPIPAGHKRDFFCLDSNTWVWHEQWRDENNKLQTSTTRYEVQSTGILKAQDGHVYKYIEGEELSNLAVAIELYYRRCMRDVYGRNPDTGAFLSDEAIPATI